MPITEPTPGLGDIVDPAWHVEVEDSIRALEAAATLFARKTADETVNNSSTLQDDNHLTIPVAANSVYVVEVWLLYDSNTTADFRHDFTFPAGATLSRSAAGLVSGAAGQSGDLQAAAANRAASGGAVITLGGGGSGSPVGVMATGLLIVGATAGDIKLQWAQGTANASDTILRADSFMRLTKLP